MEGLEEILSELELLEKSATPGPWCYDPDQHHAKNQRLCSANVVRSDHLTTATLHITAWKIDRRDARPDARLMAVSRNALPGLIAALRVSIDALKFVQEETKLSGQDFGLPHVADRASNTLAKIRRLLGKHG